MATEKIVGIIGGMGPEATIDLMRRIIMNTPAQDDADHIRCIVDNNPKIPSRIKALIEGRGESPGPAMAEMGRRLEEYGADFLAIPCNTAHAYYEDVRSAVSIPVLHIVHIAVAAAMRMNPKVSRIGILASPAVRTTRLYANILELYGLQAVYPCPEEETALLDTIRKIKQGKVNRALKENISEIVHSLAVSGADMAIAACTELGLVFNGEQCGLEIVDAAEALAREIVAIVKKT